MSATIYNVLNIKSRRRKKGCLLVTEKGRKESTSHPERKVGRKRDALIREEVNAGVLVSSVGENVQHGAGEMGRALKACSVKPSMSEELQEDQSLPGRCLILFIQHGPGVPLQLLQGGGWAGHPLPLSLLQGWRGRGRFL